MASLLNISDGKLAVTVAPDNGGMISQITINGKDVLKMDNVALDITPMSAGGIPILFPFPSKTKDDKYLVDGKEYYMPVHGFVKNSAFAVSEITENKIVLWRDACDSEIERNYPFDYELKLEYEVKYPCVIQKVYITNRSDNKMPHYIGFHPFFKSTDKSALSFTHNTTKHYLYAEGRDIPSEQEIDLSRRWDDVFHSSTTGTYDFENRADKYKIRCEFDEQFKVLVVCSWNEGAMCLQPWCGLPDSINNGRFVQYVDPHTTQVLQIKWTVEEI